MTERGLKKTSTFFIQRLQTFFFNFFLSRFLRFLTFFIFFWDVFYTYGLSAPQISSPVKGKGRIRGRTGKGDEGLAMSNFAFRFGLDLDLQSAHSI